MVYVKKFESLGLKTAKLKGGFRYVDLKRCKGCGICENKCPVRGRPAIRVIAAGESRSLKNQILLTARTP